MSDCVHRLGADTVALLLELLELREPILSGAAADMMPAAVIDGLLAARLLVEHGHELVSASLADHDDVPVSLIPSADGREHGYFSPAVGWVAVPNARLKLYRVDVGAVLRMLAAHLNLPRGWSPEPVGAGAVWELGEARIGNRTLRIPIWFARRAFDAANWRGVASAARDRPHVRQRVILTSTRSTRLLQWPIDGHLVVSLTDILVARDVFAIDPKILDARLGGVAPVANDRPIVLSPDGRQLVINGGEPIPFRSSGQIAAIRKLVAAYDADKRLRASEISEHGSLERFFGAKKWKQLEPYLITRSGFWRFEP